MVLYGTDTNMYYVFIPGHEAPTWAPKQGVNDKKIKKVQKNLVMSKNCCNFARFFAE